MPTTSSPVKGAMVDARGNPEAHNMRLVGHCNMDWRGDGMHINLKDGYAYFAHMGDHGIGTSIVDVRDPQSPRLVKQLPVPDGIHSHKVQIVGDTLLVNYEKYKGGTGQGGLKVFDLSNPTDPREVAFLKMSGKGVHRMTWFEGNYAYVTGSQEGWNDQFLMIVDLSDRANPHEVGRFWMPGQHTAGGEQLNLPPGRVNKLHHAIPRGDRLYCGWWSLGLVILDIADKTQPKLISHLDFGAWQSDCTHTALPLPGRDIVITTDESTANECQEVAKHVRVVDISDEKNPKEVSHFPIPGGDYPVRGGRFGPHNLHEQRPGTPADPNTVYVTYFNGGIRVYDVTIPAVPQEIAYFVPEAPQGRQTIQLNDLIVGPDNLIYASDRFAGGLYIFEMTGRG